MWSIRWNRNYICSVILLGLVSMGAALTDPPQTDWPPIEVIAPYINNTDKCKKSFGISKDKIQIFASTPQMYDDDRNFKCYIYCAYHENGAVLPSGKLDKIMLLKIVETLSPENQIIMLNMGKSCLAQKEKDICDRMYGVSKCMKLADPVHFYLF